MPDKFNPFRPDKIAPPSIFAGRLEEIRLIDHCLLQTKNGNPQHFLLIGERGIGKSSLFVLEQHVASGRIPTLNTNQKLSFIVINVSLVVDDDQYSLIRKILSELKKELLSRDSFKAFTLAAWNFINKIEAAGVRYNKEETSPEDSELLSHMLNDFVKLLTNLEGGINGVLPRYRARVQVGFRSGAQNARSDGRRNEGSNGRR
jgi:Cdc6-like AAA superfamily ATPase